VTKQEIRSNYLKSRLALSPDDCAIFSKKLCDLFFSDLDLSHIKTLHTFLPIISKNEPDTRLIIKRLNQGFPKIRVSIPKVENDHLINFYFEENNEFKESKWGIREPLFGEPTPSEKIDLVIVPLLAFDLKGNRLGYGKGFYDKFLSTCRPDCKKIGFSFFEPSKELIPVDQYDIPLDAVITPSRVFEFKP
jgi:5-formyltetrahydrofolate cyclo-ligase